MEALIEVIMGSEARALANRNPKFKGKRGRQPALRGVVRRSDAPDRKKTAPDPKRAKTAPDSSIAKTAPGDAARLAANLRGRALLKKAQKAVRLANSTKKLPDAPADVAARLKSVEATANRIQAKLARKRASRS